MSYFDRAVKFSLRKEDGNYDTKPKLEKLGDNAGFTFIGLTQRDDEKYLPDGLTIETLYELSKTDLPRVIQIVTDVFHTRYWNKKYDEIKSYQIAARVFDLGIVCGLPQSVRNIQTACNLLANNKALEVDGKFGPATLDAINVWIDSGFEDQLYDFLIERSDVVFGIIEKNKNRDHFKVDGDYEYEENPHWIIGWENRLYQPM